MFYWWLTQTVFFTFALLNYTILRTYYLHNVVFQIAFPNPTMDSIHSPHTLRSKCIISPEINNGFIQVPRYNLPLLIVSLHHWLGVMCMCPSSIVPVIPPDVKEVTEKTTLYENIWDWTIEPSNWPSRHLSSPASRLFLQQLLSGWHQTKHQRSASLTICGGGGEPPVTRGFP